MEQLERDFIERQRQRLLGLHKELAAATPAELEENELRAQAGGDSRELEEEAQRLATLDVDARLVAREMRRRAHVERALQKINEGTYGVSDDSGEPIARERLESMPEAIYSVNDESLREERARSGVPLRD